MSVTSVSASTPPSGRYAAIIPVGPGPIEMWRAVELAKSLIRWEPSIPCCLFLDDDPNGRPLADLAFFPSTCRVKSLVNPRLGIGLGWTGGLTTGLLSALRWVETETDFEWVIKIDADALVIGRFAAAVETFLSHTLDAGIIGTVGPSCNPEIRAFSDLSRECTLLRVHRLLRPASAAVRERAPEWVDVGILRISLANLLAFDAIRPVIRAALANGYTNSEYCQGGAYVITRTAISRMHTAGYLDTAPLWMGLPFYEDQTMAVHARAVGLGIFDLSRPGEPFGVQYRGLPYPPETLLSMGYSLIHSVKTDQVHHESSIRHFFAHRHIDD
jgi:hypothetical protein